jgi:hypothetical protein
MSEPLMMRSSAFGGSGSGKSSFDYQPTSLYQQQQQQQHTQSPTSLNAYMPPPAQPYYEASIPSSVSGSRSSLHARKAL